MFHYRYVQLRTVSRYTDTTFLIMIFETILVFLNEKLICYYFIYLNYFEVQVLYYRFTVQQRQFETSMTSFILTTTYLLQPHYYQFAVGESFARRRYRRFRIQSFEKLNQ
jgi:hypothetical protein